MTWPLVQVLFENSFVLDHMFIISSTFIVSWSILCLHNLNILLVSVFVYIIKNNFKIYFKSLLFISLESDTEVNWYMLKYTGIMIYSWWMVSFRNKYDIRKYIHIGAVYSFVFLDNICRSWVEMNDISPSCISVWKSHFFIHYLLLPFCRMSFCKWDYFLSFSRISF